MPEISFEVTARLSPLPDEIVLDALLPDISDHLYESFEEVLAGALERGREDLSEFEADSPNSVTVSASEEDDGATVTYSDYGWGPGVSFVGGALERSLEESFELEGGFSLSAVQVRVEPPRNTNQDLNYG